MTKIYTPHYPVIDDETRKIRIMAGGSYSSLEHANGALDLAMRIYFSALDRCGVPDDVKSDYKYAFDCLSYVEVSEINE